MAYDGTHVWKYLAGASPKAAEIVKGTEAALFKLNAPFFGYLLEPDRYDLVVKTVSWESFNGKEIYNVQVQIADGMRLDYAIDPETFRILRMTTYEGDRARNSVFSDFRPVDTLTEPFKTDVLENGEFDSTQIIQQFDINPGVTNAVFEYPQEAQTLQARRMEGSNPSA